MREPSPPSGAKVRLTDLFQEKQIEPPAGVPRPEGDRLNPVQALMDEKEALLAENAGLKARLQELSTQGSALVQARFDQAVAALKTGDPMDAIGLFQAVLIMAGPGEQSLTVKARINLAVAYDSLGFTGRAIRVLEDVAAAHPDNRIAASNLSLLKARAARPSTTET